MKQSVAWRDGFLYTRDGFLYRNVTEIDCWGLDFSIQILIIMLKLYLIQTQHFLYNGTTMESSTQMHLSFVQHMFLS